MQKPAFQSSRLVPICDARRRTRRAVAASLLVAGPLLIAGVGLAPAAAAAAESKSCQLMLATAIDFQRGDGAGPVREAATAPSMNPNASAMPGQDHATGGPMRLSQVTARTGDTDESVTRVGWSRFSGVLSPYAFCNNDVAMEDLGAASLLLGSPALGLSESVASGVRPADAAGVDPAATENALPPGMMLDDALTPSGFGGDTSEDLWPNFIGGAERRPVAASAARRGQVRASFAEAGFADPGGVDLPSNAFPGGFAAGRPDASDPDGTSGQTVDTTGASGLPGDPSHLSAAVPEPASWLLMLGGFGVLGRSLRRRRRVVARA